MEVNTVLGIFRVKEKYSKVERKRVVNGEISLEESSFSEDKTIITFTELKKIGSGYNADVYCCINKNEVLKVGDPASLAVEYVISHNLHKIEMQPIYITTAFANIQALSKPLLDNKYFANNIREFSPMQREGLYILWRKACEYAMITGIPLDLKADNIWWNAETRQWIVVDAGPKLDDDDDYKFEFTLDLLNGEQFIQKITGKSIITPFRIKFEKLSSGTLYLTDDKNKTIQVLLPNTNLINYKEGKEKFYRQCVGRVKDAVYDKNYTDVALFYLKCIPLTQEIIDLISTDIQMSKKVCEIFSVCLDIPENKEILEESVRLQKSFTSKVSSIVELRKDTEAYHATLSKGEKDALSRYTGSQYTPMNSCLRDGTTTLMCNAETVQNIILLDKALTHKNAPRLKKEIIVYRGIDEDKDDTAKKISLALAHLKPGDFWEDRGFVSTSVQHPPAGFVGTKCCIFEIRLPAGTPAYYIGSDSSVSHEEEVILLPGILLRFLGKKTGNEGVLYKGNRYVTKYLFTCAECGSNTNNTNRFMISPPPKELGIHTERVPFQPVDVAVGKDRLSYYHLTNMYNKYIPKKNNNVLRLMSWNIHEWRNKNKENREKEILGVIENLKPDILGLQEVTKSNIDGVGCQADMGSHGERLRNDIVVHHLEKFFESAIPIGHQRCMMVVGIQLNEKEKILVGNLHLDVSNSKNRLDNIDTALTSIEKIASEHNVKNIVLMGDFNSYSRKDYVNEKKYKDLENLKKDLSDGMEIFEAIDYLEKKGYSESFGLKRAVPPINTNIYGGRIDFIFLSPSFNLDLIASYAYYNDFSDHIAILADFNVVKEKKKTYTNTDFVNAVKNDDFPKVEKIAKIYIDMGMLWNGIHYAKTEKMAYNLARISVTHGFIDPIKEFFDKYGFERRDELANLASETFQKQELIDYIRTYEFKNPGKNPDKPDKIAQTIDDKEKIHDFINAVKTNNLNQVQKMGDESYIDEKLLVDAMKYVKMQMGYTLAQISAKKGFLKPIQEFFEKKNLLSPDTHKKELQKLLGIAINNGKKELFDYLEKEIEYVDKYLKKGDEKNKLPKNDFIAAVDNDDFKQVEKIGDEDSFINEKIVMNAMDHAKTEAMGYLLAQISVKKGFIAPIWHFFDKYKHKNSHIEQQRIRQDLLNLAIRTSQKKVINYLKEEIDHFDKYLKKEDEYKNKLPEAHIGNKKLDFSEYLKKEDEYKNKLPEAQIGNKKLDFSELYPKQFEDKKKIEDDKKKLINQSLIDSIYSGKLERVIEALKRGADIHHAGEMALRVASRDGYFEIVKYLVENGADIHAVDDNALFMAIINGQYKIVRYLVEQGANIHINEDEALITASEYGHLKIVQYLIEQGANIHTQNDKALKKAKEKGHTEIVKLLEHGEEIDTHIDTNLSKDQLLMNGADSGELNVVIDAIKKGADIHVGDDASLRFASFYGHYEIVKYLLEHGANIHAENDYALRYASRNGDYKIVRYLVEHGANIHAKNDQALKWAKKMGHIEIVKLLEGEKI